MYSPVPLLPWSVMLPAHVEAPVTPTSCWPTELQNSVWPCSWAAAVAVGAMPSRLKLLILCS